MSGPLSRRVLSSREANSKSQKFSPCKKMGGGGGGGGAGLCSDFFLVSSGVFFRPLSQSVADLKNVRT